MPLLKRHRKRTTPEVEAYVCAREDMKSLPDWIGVGLSKRPQEYGYIYMSVISQSRFRVEVSTPVGKVDGIEGDVIIRDSYGQLYLLDIKSFKEKYEEIPDE